MSTTKRFERILLATDGSEAAQAAVDATIAIAKSPTAKVRVAHVWNLEVHHRHGFWDIEMRSEAQKLVDVTVERLLNAGVIAEREIDRADSKHVAAARHPGVHSPRLQNADCAAFLVDGGYCGASAQATWTARERRRIRRPANHHGRGLARRIRARAGRRSRGRPASQARLLPQHRCYVARTGGARDGGTRPGAVVQVIWRVHRRSRATSRSGGILGKTSPGNWIAGFETNDHVLVTLHAISPEAMALIEEVAAPHRNFGIAIDVVLPPDRAGEPVVPRSPAILYGLGNLTENAVDFAAERVEIAVRWSEQDVAVTISDDGPGFPPEILSRIGEPYVTSRRRPPGDSEESGLGLGFFIAKTLLERSGAALAFLNRPAPSRVPWCGCAGRAAISRWRKARP